MSSPQSAHRLMDLVDSPDLFDLPYEEIAPMQLEAARDLYALRRQKLAILRERGDDCGVTDIRSLADVVPLLFSHTTYKSYPETFISNRRWALLTRWFDTVSAVPVEVDVTGVETIDDWVDRMWENGHHLYATSGTTGKCSFLNNTKADRDFVERGVARYTFWPKPLDPNGPKMRYYQAWPSNGPQAPMHWFAVTRKLFGRPDASFSLSEPIKVSHLSRVGAMRKAMSENKVTSSEVAAYEDEMKKREARLKAELRAMVADLVEHRNELIMINFWSQMTAVLQIARELGVKDGEFPNLYSWGRPRKRIANVASLEDLEAEANRFFTPKQMFGAYGMTELSLTMPECEAGRYHVPPWIMVLLLDRKGNELAPAEGISEGRAGFMDFSREGRWGGIMSGDKIQVDFSGKCACGRRGLTILDTVSRYADTGSDKVDCAGTFDAYVRGVMEVAQ